MNQLFRWIRFNWWYFRSPPWDTGITPPELAAFIGAHAPGKALDLGCGTGTNLVSLARAGWTVVGVDFALKAAAAAKKKLQAAGLAGRVVQGDVTGVHLGEAPFDLVVDIGCYHGLTDLARKVYRRNLRNLLADQGTFLIYLHLKHDPGSSWGITEDEITAFQQELRLKSRTNSFDRNGRQAAWMEFVWPA